MDDGLVIGTVIIPNDGMGRNTVNSEILDKICDGFIYSHLVLYYSLYKVCHILDHTSGLQNAFADILYEDPIIISDFDECLKRISMIALETEPGQEHFYDYLSYGWLCGGLIQVPLHTHSFKFISKGS